MSETRLSRIMPAKLHVGLINVRHIPFLLFAYASLLPRELRVEVLDAGLFPYRLALLFMIPFAIANVAKFPIKPSLIDVFAAFAALWIPIALYITTSLEAALTTGVSFSLDIGLAYFIGRSAIRTPQDLRTIFLCLLPGILFTVGILAIESLSHRTIMRPMLASLVGDPAPYFAYQVRFGLMRATGPFPHPILGGVFLAGILPFAWYFSHNNWQRLVGCAAAMGTIFTVSSAAILGLGVAVLLIVLDIVQRLSRLPVFLFAGFYSAIMIIMVTSLSQSGLLSLVVRRLTFDSQTGYYRMLIWEYGGAEAMANPVFGIGQRDWIRPTSMPSDSIDAYWLLLSMLYGFPAAAAVLLMMIGAIVGLLRTQKFRHPADADCAKGMIFFLIIVIFCGFTVHLWDNVHAWALSLVGAAVSLSTQTRSVPAPIVVQEDEGSFGWIKGAFGRPSTL